MLRAADLFLLTTEPPESFGIVLIEAMACGLPAIATDYPGVRAVVDDGETGLLVARGDPDAVAAALGELVGDPERRAGDGRARPARRRSREWSWPQLVERMDGAYAEAIAARDGGAPAGRGSSSSPTSTRRAATPGCCARRRWRSGCAGSATRSRC